MTTRGRDPRRKAVSFDYDDTLVQTRQCQYRAPRALGSRHDSNASNVPHAGFRRAVLLVALGLVMLCARCHARPSNDSAIQAPQDEGVPCVSPEQAGCTECCVQQPGPTPGEQACYLRKATAAGHDPQSKGHDYAEQAELRNLGPCPATCRTCSACTSDRQKSYQYLLAKGCDCFDPFVRQASDGLDPCFSSGCGCTCAQLAELSACGPRH